MSSRGRKLFHCFNKFVHVKKDIKVNQSNYLAVYQGCVTVKGWIWTEAKACKINMSNTVPSIGKHLSVCENFKTTYLNRVECVKENIETRKQRTAKLRTVNNLKRQLNQLPELNENDDNLSQTSFFTRLTASTEAAAKDDKYDVSISLDGWKNVVKQNILGLVITRSDGQVLIWGAKDISRIANLCIADVFKSSLKLLETSKNTTAIIKYFNALLKFTKDLYNEQKKKYNKYITLIQPGQTRWNSYYFCYQSVLKNKNDLSDVTVVHEKEEGNNDNKLMTSKIISIIDNPDFWINLVELEKILYPYCAALNLLQKDKARLYDVLHSFGYFMQCTSECDDDDYREMMIRRLER
ncbi:hypothetical protein C1646_750818 [Rhizophagus diaphanus]|nr:hypothetical protein C1646_750818 [Rhizophagus diaphanus] [Rhizophagus sp. MUCL 43196]